MMSHFCVSEVSKKVVRGELELIDHNESLPEDFETKPTKMIDVPMRLFREEGYKPVEGDIYLLEHEEDKDNRVSCIIWLDEEEKERRENISKN